MTIAKGIVTKANDDDQCLFFFVHKKKSVT